MKIKKRAISLEIIFSVLIILLPFFYQYKGIGNIISFGEVLLAPFIAYYTFQSIGRIKKKDINRPLLYYYAGGLALTCLNIFAQYFSLEAASTIVLRLIYYLLLVFVARRHFRFDEVRKFYNYLVIIASLYLIAQFIMYHGFGHILPIYLKLEWQFPPEARPINIYTLGFRPSSLFLEASYFALFVLPSICINLFTEYRKPIDTVTFITACVAIVLSTSSAGVIGVALLLFIKMFRSKEKLSVKRVSFNILMIVAVITAASYIMTSQNSLLLRSRLTSGGSIGERVLRGFIVYGKLPLFHKIFGVGIGNMESYMLYNGISTIYDESNLNSCASVAQTMVYFGIIGLCFLLYFIYSSIKRAKGNIGFPLAILLTYIMCYDNIMFYFKFAFIFILLEAIVKEESSPKRGTPFCFVKTKLQEETV